MHKADLDKTIDTLNEIAEADRNNLVPHVFLGTILDSLYLLQEYKKKRTPADMELEGGGSSWWNVCPECHGVIDKNDHFCKHCGQAVK